VELTGTFSVTNDEVEKGKKGGEIVLKKKNKEN